MCLMCIDFQKGKMNIQEAKSNLSEAMLSTKDLTQAEINHLIDLYWADSLAEELIKFKEVQNG